LHVAIDAVHVRFVASHVYVGPGQGEVGWS